MKTPTKSEGENTVKWPEIIDNLILQLPTPASSNYG